MMFRKLMTVAALAAVTATAASAQEAVSAKKPFTFGVNAGAAIPMGDFGDAVKTGFGFGGTAGYKVATLPVGFRVDANFNQFSGKGGGNFRAISVMGNVVYDIPMQSSLRPYVLGGVGFMNGKPKGADAENAFAFNGGAGITLPLSGFDTYLEARYSHASKNGSKVQFVPIVFGIKF